MRPLRASWTRIERCTAAMAAIVTIGIITMGSFRVALIEGGVEADDVPTAQQVLVYGLFFAVIVVVVVVPLLLAYRRRAGQYLVRSCPPRDSPADMDKAAELDELLHLSSGP